MSDYKNEIKNARFERETGDLNKSLEMFLDIEREDIDKPNQLFDYLGELGLTYFHLKDYENAKKYYEEALELAEKLENDSYKAVAYKHLSNLKFNGENTEKALEYAMEARKSALKAGRKDLVWFDGGIITALFDKGASEEEIENWISTAIDDLNRVGSLEKDETAKWVWFTGILMDMAKLYKSKTKLDLAYFVADQFGLERRKEQIEELRKEFN